MADHNETDDPPTDDGRIVTFDWQPSHYHDTPRLDQWVWCPACGSEHVRIVVGQMANGRGEDGAQRTVPPFKQYALLQCDSCGAKSKPQPMWPIAGDETGTPAGGVWATLRSLVRRLLA